MGSMLGAHPVCTSLVDMYGSGDRTDSLGGSLHYSIGHWVEDDPVGRRWRVQ